MLVEIRFHGRGGQGAVTASKLLVEAALLEGKWGQSFPFFGAERRGAPVTAYARISDSPIKIHQQIYEPDIVVVLDPKIFQIVDITEGLKRDGIIIVNTKENPRDYGLESFKVYGVNATDICLKLGLVMAGWPLVNTSILGAISRVTNVVKMDSIIKVVKSTWPGEVGEKNAKAVLIAYEEVKEY